MKNSKNKINFKSSRNREFECKEGKILGTYEFTVGECIGIYEVDEKNSLVIITTMHSKVDADCKDAIEWIETLSKACNYNILVLVNPYAKFMEFIALRGYNDYCKRPLKIFNKKVYMKTLIENRYTHAKLN